MRDEWAQYSESVRVFYSMVLAHMAGVDGQFAAEERERILELCSDYGLSSEARQNVLNAVTMPRAWLDVILSQLSMTDLRYSLLIDVCAMAQADGVIEAAEEKTIVLVARAMKISDEHLEALEMLSNEIVAAALPGAGPEALEQALAQLEAAGVPRAALQASFALARLRGAEGQG